MLWGPLLLLHILTLPLRSQFQIFTAPTSATTAADSSPLRNIKSHLQSFHSLTQTPAHQRWPVHFASCVLALAINRRSICDILTYVHVTNTSYREYPLFATPLLIMSDLFQNTRIQDLRQALPIRYWSRVPKSPRIVAFTQILLAGPTTLRIPLTDCGDQYT